MEDIILETVMLQRPPEWGRRVIQRGDEILLQTTEDSGKTWTDAPIPEVKLIISPNTKTLKSASADTNKYSGISFYLRESKGQPMTKSAIPANTQIDPKSFNPKILESIESGTLLTTTDIANEQGVIVENISFLGVYSAEGLSPGQVWRDSQNYLRIVP